jgi:hypothetical protein
LRGRAFTFILPVAMRGAREGILTGANDLTVGFTITKGRARVEDSTSTPSSAARFNRLVVELENSESIIAFTFGDGNPLFPSDEDSLSERQFSAGNQCARDPDLRARSRMGTSHAKSQ